MYIEEIWECWTVSHTDWNFYTNAPNYDRTTKGYLAEHQRIFTRHAKDRKFRKMSDAKIVVRQAKNRKHTNWKVLLQPYAKRQSCRCTVQSQAVKNMPLDEISWPCFTTIVKAREETRVKYSISWKHFAWVCIIRLHRISSTIRQINWIFATFSKEIIYK